MAGDYTRFEHALKSAGPMKRFSWRKDQYDPEPTGLVVLNGAEVVACAEKPEMAELLCTAMNYMLELNKQIGTDADYRDDLLKRAVETLEGCHTAECRSTHGPGDETWTVEKDCNCYLGELKNEIKNHLLHIGALDDSRGTDPEADDDASGGEGLLGG